MTYTNSSQSLGYAPVAGSGNALTVSNVSGCAGAFANGDTMTFTATFQLSTTLGALAVTSP